MVPIGNPCSNHSLSPPRYLPVFSAGEKEGRYTITTVSFPGHHSQFRSQIHTYIKFGLCASICITVHLLILNVICHPMAHLSSLETVVCGSLPSSWGFPHPHKVFRKLGDLGANPWFQIIYEYRMCSPRAFPDFHFFNAINVPVTHSLHSYARACFHDGWARIFYFPSTRSTWVVLGKLNFLPKL